MGYNKFATASFNCCHPEIVFIIFVLRQFHSSAHSTCKSHANHVSSFWDSRYFLPTIKVLQNLFYSNIACNRHNCILQTVVSVMKEKKTHSIPCSLALNYGRQLFRVSNQDKFTAAKQRTKAGGLKNLGSFVHNTNIERAPCEDRMGHSKAGRSNNGL